MSQSAKKFVVDYGWQVLLTDLGVCPQDLLRQARLPLDLFSRPHPTLATEEYFRIFEGLEVLMDDPHFPLRLGQAVSPEAFSPPVFACFCSPDLNVALSRLAQYKPLIGPMVLNVSIKDDATTIAMGELPTEAPLPQAYVAIELVFLVHMARKATRERIVPKTVHMIKPMANVEVYEEFFGIAVKRDTFNGLSFIAKDATKPFLTANYAMWSVFEPELRTRMHDLATDALFSERVRTCLVEILASGQCSMDDVAKRLAVSPRTLQRRLSDEGTSFQPLLSGLREELARHYLTNSRYTGGEISFLLGYNDPNSFFRAFHAWTGQTPETLRQVNGALH